MQKLMCRVKCVSDKFCRRFKNILTNTDGDQITGWLIVVLLVVVVGAFFLSTYQDTITEVWQAIVDKIYDTFGI